MRKVDELSCVADMIKPDLILITESWCNEDISDAHLSIEGYELVPDLRMDRDNTVRGRGGGLLVYVKNSVKVLKLDQSVKFHQYCRFNVNDVTFYLIYRSPNSPPETMNELENLVRSVEKKAVLIGDFNLPDVDWSTGVGAARSRDFLEAVDDSLLEQLVYFPTHIRGNCLDLVLTNIPERILEISEAGRLGSSDHEMIFVTISMEGKAREQTKQGLNWRRADWESMRLDMAYIDWRTVLMGLSTQDMWLLFRSKIEQTIKKNVPDRKLRTGGRAAWMSREIMAAVRRKKRLWRKAKSGSCMEDYREADKLVKNLIRSAKRGFEKKLANANGGSSRPFYSYVKRRTKSKPAIGPLLDKDRKTISDNKGMADLLNGFFSSVFTREDLQTIPVAEQMQTTNLERIAVTEKMVRDKIKNLKPFSAAGPDGIGPQLLQELREELVPALVVIFRHSLKTGQVPSDWRQANVTPIFKKGRKSEPGNYRPVSLTSVCCRILETIIRDIMMQHLLRNNLLNDSQHGFMPQKSCCTNLLEFFETVTSVIDQGEPFDAIFLDFAKAFDKVPKERLLEKLKAHGVRGEPLAWIRSWLTNRQQRVVINGECSDWEEVLSGVPQGSVLGPPLFTVYINDVDGVAKFIQLMKKFADDTKMGQTATPEGVEKLQQALDKLCEWAQQWGMQFNVQKCKVMHFGFNNNRQEYSMNGHKLESTEEERDIGVSVAKNLKPSGQCKKAARTAQTVLSQLTRAFHYRDRHVFVRLYIQYVRPHLEFSSPAWSPWLAGDKEVLEKVQKRAIRMVSGLRADSYEGRLSELGLTTLEERRHQADMVQTYKIVTSKDRVNSETWFKSVTVTGRATRSAADPLNLRPQASRLDVRRNFFSQRVIEDWNSIPAQIKQAKSVQSFKKSYAKFRAERVECA